MHLASGFDSRRRTNETNKKKITMKTMNVIFAIIFALCAAMALVAAVFCKATHQLPIFIGSALMSAVLYNTRNNDENK
jgi:hypothetical protein